MSKLPVKFVTPQLVLRFLNNVACLVGDTATSIELARHSLLQQSSNDGYETSSAIPLSVCALLCAIGAEIGQALLGPLPRARGLGASSNAGINDNGSTARAHFDDIRLDALFTHRSTDKAPQATLLSQVSSFLTTRDITHLAQTCYSMWQWARGSPEVEGVWSVTSRVWREDVVTESRGLSLVGGWHWRDGLMLPLNHSHELSVDEAHECLRIATISCPWFGLRTRRAQHHARALTLHVQQRSQPSSALKIQPFFVLHNSSPTRNVALALNPTKYSIFHRCRGLCAKNWYLQICSSYNSRRHSSLWFESRKPFQTAKGTQDKATTEFAEAFARSFDNDHTNWDSWCEKHSVCVQRRSPIVQQNPAVSQLVLALDNQCLVHRSFFVSSTGPIANPTSTPCFETVTAVLSNGDVFGVLCSHEVDTHKEVNEHVTAVATDYVPSALTTLWGQ